MKREVTNLFNRVRYNYIEMILSLNIQLSYKNQTHEFCLLLYNLNSFVIPGKTIGMHT